MSKKKKSVLFISSVGGHLTQLMQLKPLFQEYDYYLVTEKTVVTKGMKSEHPMSFLVYGARNYPVSYLFKFSFNFLKSLGIFLKKRPDVVVTTGVHTAVPMCWIAKLFRRKVVFIESFAKTSSPTLSGRLVYPIADLFIVQWETMLKHYPKAVHGGSIY
ncbi:PssD/Cps14F family polysaccharide biosynthesis glycosyltransferase [Salibacterium halotolerans]|uniref:Oligosaccharide biosynthesis protein Alg14 like n=1 Tax=Salibacterium halotolerans TaxID=1884432 RepID=A0A1I5WWR0_9BACI|nr:PssD/Cps14F family polysaccharide biosynthesis glycosyltransferase [Salibacterium halotolerans]SFQ24183.1 Oligosaccharide biosynthesis protein Alg14 like [Salibacterium halotolerans]